MPSLNTTSTSEFIVFNDYAMVRKSKITGAEVDYNNGAYGVKVKIDDGTSVFVTPRDEDGGRFIGSAKAAELLKKLFELL